MESMIEQKKIEDICDHRDFNELYSFDDGYKTMDIRRIDMFRVCKDADLYK